MQSSATPTLTPIAFATSGTKNTIPEAASSTPGVASFTNGFPPETMIAVAAGGTPPAGADMNGVLYALSAHSRWVQAGGRYAYNSAFAGDSGLAGYPAGARVMTSDLRGSWMNITENNSTDPEGASPSGWIPMLDTYGYASVPLTTGSVTLTPGLYRYGVIHLTGTLTGNCTVIMPAWYRTWTFINLTTGNYTVTVITASGTGVVLSASGETQVEGDGANMILRPQQMAPATLPTHSATLGQIGHGQCRLAVASTTALTLTPYDGNNVIVNGVPLTLPTAGVTYTLSGLAASTVYYVYLGGTTAAPVLSVSTTAYTTQTSGITTMTGNTALTLVGMVCTSTTTTFVNAANQRFCINWFNRKNIGVLFTSGSTLTFSTSTLAEIATNFRAYFLTWPDEAVAASVSGYVTSNTAGQSTSIALNADGGSGIGSTNTFTSYAANADGQLTSSYTGTFTVGVHYLQVYGSVTSGTSSLFGGAQTAAMIRG